jgi:pSer/pThr/pTyr-binding forkhead associated (FHA) protein
MMSGDVESRGRPGCSEWEVRVVVDRLLDGEPDTGGWPPLDAGERLFPVDRPEMLVGRRDDQHGIRPEIPILDPGVSRRHASLLSLPGGGLAILDLASANGTAVNGEEVVAGQRRELRDGDTVTIGRWTRITVHLRC